MLQHLAAVPPPPGRSGRARADSSRPAGGSAPPGPGADRAGPGRTGGRRAPPWCWRWERRGPTPRSWWRPGCPPRRPRTRASPSPAPRPASGRAPRRPAPGAPGERTRAAMVSMVSIRLCTTNTWPPRSSSRANASSSSPSSHGSTKVRMGDRSRGGVSIRVRSRSPASDRCSVRGIGVAVSVSTSTASRSSLSRSLCFTPNRCSSSTTRRPRSLNSTSLESSRWVPMTMSVLPSASRASACFCSFAVRKRESTSTLTGIIGQPLDEGAAVLLGQNRGRHQHRHLLAALHRLERRPHRDLGLAVPTSPTSSRSIGTRPLHVALDLLGGLALVGGVLVEEARLQLPLPPGVGRKGVARAHRAAGVEVEQLGRHLLDRLAGLLPRSLPGGAAQPVELGRRPVAVLAGGAVALQLIEPVERDVEPVAALVLHDRHLDGGLAHHDRLDAAVDPDPVVEMDDVVAGGERAGGERRRGLAVAPGPAQPPGPAEDLVVGEHPERSASRTRRRARRSPAWRGARRGRPRPAARRAARAGPRCRRGSGWAGRRRAAPRSRLRLRSIRSGGRKPNWRSACSLAQQRAGETGRAAPPRPPALQKSASRLRHVFAQPPGDLEMVLRLPPGPGDFVGVGAGGFLDDEGVRRAAAPAASARARTGRRPAVRFRRLTRAACSPAAP